MTESLSEDPRERRLHPGELDARRSRAVNPTERVSKRDQRSSEPPGRNSLLARELRR